MQETNDLSLYSLYQKIQRQQIEYGEKLDRLYELYSGTLRFPEEVTNGNDSPTLWPDNGVNVYAIYSEYNLAKAFCSTGILFNIGQGKYKYQTMLVQYDELNEEKMGKMYYRYSKSNANEWSQWKRIACLYELKGAIDSEGNPYIDEFGNEYTDSVDESIDKEYKIVVSEAQTAHKLTNKIKLELNGAVQGNVTFDCSEDIILNTVAQETIPLNIQLEPKKYLQDTYRLICSLPSQEDNYNYAVITGHLGGKLASDGKAHITITITNTDNIEMNGFVVGNVDAEKMDIVAYTVPSAKGYILNVYLKIKANTYTEDIKLGVYGSETINIKNMITSLPIGSKKVWQLTENCVRVEGNNIFGNIIGTVTNSDYSNHTKLVQLVEKSDTKGYLNFSTEIDGEGYSKVYIDKGIYKTNNSGELKANKFVGNLQGLADEAILAHKSEKIYSYLNVKQKGYLLGTIGADYQQPIFDKNIYITPTEGELYAHSVKGRYNTVTNLKTDNAEINDLDITNTIVLNNKKDTYIDLQGKTLYAYKDKINSFGDTGLKFYQYGNEVGMQLSGVLKVNKMYSSEYNDYAEYFPKGEETEPGDVLMLDINAKEEVYIKCQENAKCIAGVHSEEYGMIVGQPDNAEEIKNYVPVALAGRVKVNVIGKCSKGDKLVPSHNGCARVFNSETDSLENVIGYLIESDDLIIKRKLKMKIK